MFARALDGLRWLRPRKTRGEAKMGKGQETWLIQINDSMILLSFRWSITEISSRVLVAEASAKVECFESQLGMLAVAQLRLHGLVTGDIWSPGWETCTGLVTKWIPGLCSTCLSLSIRLGQLLFLSFPMKCPYDQQPGFHGAWGNGGSAAASTDLCAAYTVTQCYPIFNISIICFHLSLCRWYRFPYSGHPILRTLCSRLFFGSDSGSHRSRHGREARHGITPQQSGEWNMFCCVRSTTIVCSVRPGRSFESMKSP